jgi:transcriptional regulator with XRE-family HTH domain
MDFATRIKTYRKQKGFSQLELAVFLGVSPGTIGNWEKNRSTPVEDALSTIARKMGVGEEWLRTGEGEMFSAHDTGLSPARSTVQNPTPTHHDLITSRSEGDMTYDPSWVVPILLSAHIAMMHRDDLEKARTMKEAGRRFRVRLVVEEEDKPPENIPPQK